MNRCAWRVASAPDEIVARLAGELGCSRLTAAVLVGRGTTDAASAARFFAPRLDELHDPGTLPDLAAGVARLQRAIADRETVLVYGDRDVDGMTSIAVLTAALREYLPEEKLRFTVPSADEGYGLNVARARRFQADGATLVVTVDCGVTAVDEVAALAAAGLDVVITDHHEPAATLPAAVAVIDPKRSDSRYPWRDLAGVGVALKVGEALVAAQGDDPAAWRARVIEVAALGTIADMVPLGGENRVIAWHGLRAIADSPWPAMQALAGSARLAAVPTGRDLAFGVSPLLNAAGRLGENELGARLFLSRTEAEAEEFIRQLQDLNRRRKELEKINLAAALEQLPGQYEPDRDRVIVLALAGVAHGVTGLVAQQLRKRHDKPVFVLIVEDGVATGTGRSVEGWDLLAAVRQCAAPLTRYGGHRQAVGLALPADKIDEFRAALGAVAARELPPAPPRPELAIDAETGFREIDLPGIADLARLEPTGTGNPAPRFCTRGARLISRRTMGNNHLRLALAHGGRILNVVGWGRGALADRLLDKRFYDIAYTLEVNRWQDREEPRLVLEDIAEGA